MHYPRSIGEFQISFASDADCLEYLTWLRCPQGSVRPQREDPSGWNMTDGNYKCASYLKQTAVTAGTPFHRRTALLTVWFEA